MITGHRPQAFPSGFDGMDDQKRWSIATIRQVIQNLRELHPDTVCMSGMAVGVDQWFAHYALQAGLPLHAVVPFVGQELRWPDRSQRAYSRLLAEATTRTILRSTPPRDSQVAARWLNERNGWMVDHADVALAVWNEKPGGTGHTVKLLRAASKPMLWANPASKLVFSENEPETYGVYAYAREG